MSHWGASVSFLINPYALGTGGGGGPPTFPTLASIWEWWEPSRNSLTPDAAIANMAGQVAPGAGHDFSRASGQPIYKDNIINGLGVARFTNQILENVDPSALTAAHLFMVVKMVTEGTATGPWKWGTSASADHYAFTDGNIYDGSLSNTRRTVGNPTPLLTDWRVVEIISTGTEWTFNLDGTQLFTTGTNTVGITSSCKLGTNGSNTKDYDFAGGYLCSAKLSGADRTSLIAYINSRFGRSSS